MSAVSKTNLHLEIAHILFIDVVGYSKLLVNEQSELLQKLNDVVLYTEQVRTADSAKQLIRLPTGDGMALVFRNYPEAPAECALEIAAALKSHSDIQVRMGVHSGPVNEVSDVNQRTNIAGAGVNMAHRVMDCGDAGHILLSKRVADDLAQYRDWQPLLHDLGEVEVKHGVKILVVNLYKDDLGNPVTPEKIKRAQKEQVRATRRYRIALATGMLIAALALGGLFWFTSHRAKPEQAVSVSAKSIAVLPFENLSSDKENAYFADGVQDEILADLAKVADLKVISRTSVMPYKTGLARNLRDIGQQLGVAHLLEGSVQRAANKVRVNAQLIDARSDEHLWAQVYDRPLDDVFAIQSEIAKAIADQLQAKLSPKERRAIEQAPTLNIEAFDLYSRAKTLNLSTSFSSTNQRSLLQAADLLNQAITRDPSFFLAYCELVHTHDQLYFYGIDHTPARRAMAEAAVEKAFALQPQAGEAHLARAETLYRGHLDFTGALAELDNARETLPNDPRIYLLRGFIRRRQGAPDDGLEDLQRSLTLDPRNPFTLQQIALSYNNLRRYGEMAEVLDRALAVNPMDLDSQVARALVEVEWKADTRRLHETIESIRANRPQDLKGIPGDWIFCALVERDPGAAEAALLALGDQSFSYDAMHFDALFCRGLLARMMGDNQKAQVAFSAARTEQEKVVQSQADYGPAVCLLGLIDAGLGRKEEALREGQRAMEILPVSKDAKNGVHMIEFFAVIAGWVGEKDLALEHLTRATRLPGTLSYGQLKLSPFWDPLRGDARFEQIVTSLAPKEGAVK